MAKGCKWYKKGKMSELTIVSEPSNSESSSEAPEIQIGDSVPFEWEAQEWPDFDDPQEHEQFDLWPEENIDRDEFRLLPQEQFQSLPQDQEENEARAGPGPNMQANQASQVSENTSNSHRALDDEDDTRFVMEHPTAGAVLQRNPPPPPPATSAQDADGDIAMDSDSEEKSPFSPFHSELDWKIAEWAIKDGPGHKAFDRLLSIPGVSDF